MGYKTIVLFIVIIANIPENKASISNGAGAVGLGLGAIKSFLDSHIRSKQKCFLESKAQSFTSRHPITAWYSPEKLFLRLQDGQLEKYLEKTERCPNTSWDCDNFNDKIVNVYTKSGCRLIACEDKDFSGFCKEFQTNEQLVNLGNLENQVSSVACSCHIPAHQSSLFHVWDDIHWKGPKKTFVLPPGNLCTNFEPRWRNTISSVNTADSCVIFYGGAGCTGYSSWLTYGTHFYNSHTDLRKLNFNDKAVSFRRCNA